MVEKQTLGIGKGKPGPGRPKGVPNKSTQLLKDAILKAADQSHPEGMVGYLQVQAIENPGPFMALLGKVLPMQVEGSMKVGVDDTIGALLARVAERGGRVHDSG